MPIIFDQRAKSQSRSVERRTPRRASKDTVIRATTGSSMTGTISYLRAITATDTERLLSSPFEVSINAIPTFNSTALDALEEPLLLNPYRESSDGILRFGDQGVVAVVDNNDRGKQTVAVYGLDRGDLPTARFRAQRSALDDLFYALRSPDRSAALAAFKRHGRADLNRTLKPPLSTSLSSGGKLGHR